MEPIYLDNLRGLRRSICAWVDLVFIQKVRPLSVVKKHEEGHAEPIAAEGYH